jgi:outer membrane protein assembly factor BamB
MAHHLRWCKGLLALALLASLAFVAPVVSPTTASAAAVNSDWPMFLHDVSRSSASTETTLSPANVGGLKLKFKFAAAGPIADSAAIVGNVLYIGDWAGYEYAVNEVTGALIWKTFVGVTHDPACDPADIGVTSAASVVGGVVYVGGGDAYWYALSAATGDVLWKVYTGDNSQAGAHYNWSSPLIAGGFGYIGIASNCDAPLVQGQLLKVNLATHEIVATTDFVPDGQVGGGVWTSPTLDVSTNTIFVTTGTLNQYTQRYSQAIVSLDASTLAIKDSWQIAFQDAVSDSDWGDTPTLTVDSSGQQLVSAMNKNGIAYTFLRSNLHQGPIWTHRVAVGGDCPTCGDGSISSSAFANGVLYLGGGNTTINGVGYLGSVTAVDPGTGSVLWERGTDGAIFTSLAYINGLLAFGQGNSLEVMNAATGTSVYNYVTPAPIYAAPSISHGKIFIGSTDGNLYVFGLPSTPTPPLPADPNCPASFACEDIGTPKVPGSENVPSGGALQVTASGGQIHGTKDQFRLISKQVNGDAQVVARLTQQSTQNTAPQAGLMVRQNDNPASPFYAILEYPNNLTENQAQPKFLIWYRTSFGGTAVEATKIYPANLPQTFAIQRHGNSFSASTSTDGVHFKLLPGTTQSVVMPDLALAGLAVDSGSAKNTGTATFDNFSVGSPTVTPVNGPSKHGCPAPWTCADVWNPAPQGDQTLANGTWSVYGSGDGRGIGGTADSFHEVYQPVSGSVAISAAPTLPAGAPGGTLSGVMLRQDSSPGSAFYSFLVKPNGSAEVLWRVNNNLKTRPNVQIPALAPGTLIRVSRFIDTTESPAIPYFSASTSTDGVTWTPVLGSTVVIDMGDAPLQAGLVAALPYMATPIATTFAGTAITPVDEAPPGICPESWVCGDLGHAGLAGNQIVLDGAWTFRASGADIWDVYDNFRFASQELDGDGTISARVVSIANANEWAKEGVMIRSGRDEQAPYYGVFVTPQHGLVVQWRSSQGGSTSQLAADPTASTPIWLLVSRYTDPNHDGTVYYTAYWSSDGKSFTAIPGSTVPLDLPGQLVSGLAADSYGEGKLATVNFDSVAQIPSAPAPPGLCPATLDCTDIGGPDLPGAQQVGAGGTGTVSGSGGDIWDVADQMHFVYTALNGDGSISAQLTDQTPTNEWAKAGVMLRASKAPGSPYYAALVTPSHGLAIQSRSSSGATTAQLDLPDTDATWLKVSRYTSPGPSGATYYTAYTSDDGQTWTEVPGSTVAIAMPDALLAGIAVTSHDSSFVSTVSVDHTVVDGTATPPLTLCPDAWSCADIGGATPAGSQGHVDGTWDFQAGGGDIWDTADQFRFAWQTLDADGAVSARVASPTDSDPWAKAGVMVRSSTDAGAAFYDVVQTPENGIQVQLRTSDDALATTVASLDAATPVYLKIVREGSNFTAFTSSDGLTWNVVPGSTTEVDALAGSDLAGLAVTSHNTSTLGSAAFDSVSVG